jgi:hypothetical protein
MIGTPGGPRPVAAPVGRAPALRTATGSRPAASHRPRSPRDTAGARRREVTTSVAIGGRREDR